MDEVDHEDLARLLAELAAKGYGPGRLEVVRSEWEAACRLGAHPDLEALVDQMREPDGPAGGKGL